MRIRLRAEHISPIPELSVSRIKATIEISGSGSSSSSSCLQQQQQHSPNPDPNPSQLNGNSRNSLNFKHTPYTHYIHIPFGILCLDTPHESSINHLNPQ